MARAKTRDTWDWGYKSRTKDGRVVYVIEKRIKGHKFHISTHATSESAAYEHAQRFQADPWRAGPTST